jgi:hypothetical protein
MKTAEELNTIAFARVRAAIDKDPVAALERLGLKAGGDLYRKGGYVKAFYIPKREFD